MLAITTPFWDGFILCAIIVGLLGWGIYWFLSKLYSDAEPRDIPKEYTRHYLDEWEEKAYH